MNLTVLSWLNKSAIDYSEKVIFKDSENELTFFDFNKMTMAIGTYLSSIIMPETPVVVMSGRHVLTIAAFLGVARAGAFYAPMDAGMPIARLNQILDVIDSPLMIVDRQNLALAESLQYDGKILILEEIVNTPIDYSRLERVEKEITGCSPLYVIFTSGSTGIPKGVITSHQSLMCYIDSFCEVLEMSDEDILGNQSPLDYIAAIRDIYIPIKIGASTVIISKNEFSMPMRLFETLNKNRVTSLCWSVAGIELPAKLGAFEIMKPEYVKKVCFSGSVISCKYLKIWQDSMPDTLFVNQYGPTEATASCTYFIVKEPVTEETVLPIGKPYGNYKILLLTEDDKPVSHGEIGEICVGGPILALGYFGDSARTSESFVQNPLNTKYRELIYKTGDLGRKREDGILEYHGRKDRQIKHLGHRIELGEIETVAKQLDSIDDCCAMYSKEKELLYLFYCGQATSKEITVHFRKVLPAFMVPRKIVALDEIPKLPNGKINMIVLKEFLNNK